MTLRDVSEREFQHFLDVFSSCYLEKNFAAFQACVLLPLTIVSRVKTEVLSTVEALAENFRLYLVACEVMSLDQIHRRPISLERSQDGLWLGTYETNLMHRGMRATEPYTSTMLLHPEATGLRTSSILNARGHYEWTGHGRRG